MPLALRGSLHYHGPIMMRILILILLPVVVRAQPLQERLDRVKVEQYAEAPGYSEGPTWRDGELFFCSGALWRVDKNRKTTRFLELGPAGTFLKADGSILICDNKTPALLELTPAGTLNVLADSFEGKKLASLNDVTVDARGNVYWTDPANSSRENPVGKVFRLTPAGAISVLADNLAFPNGLEVDPDGKYLYVIESQTAKVLRFDLPADDKPLGPATVFYALGGSGGDGCVFDADGNLWVADFSRPDKKQGRITILSPKAELQGYLNVPAKMVTNITFGGPKHDEVFMTTGTPNGVFHAAVDIKGFAGHPGKAMKVLRALNQ